MPVFATYSNTAQIHDAMQQWARNELPAGTSPLHCVEVSRFRFRIQLYTEGGAWAAKVSEVPPWQMTPRQLCNAVWRALRSCVAPRACGDAVILQQDIAHYAKNHAPRGLSYAHGKWWTAAAICDAWQRRVNALLIEAGNKAGDKAVDKGGPAGNPESATSPDVEVLPAELGPYLEPQDLQPVRTSLEALVGRKDAWTGVQWPDIERILLLLYSISSAHNGSEVVAMRDKMFQDLLHKALECLPFTMTVADRLTAAMGRLPAQATLDGMVLVPARNVCYAVAEVINRSLPGPVSKVQMKEEELDRLASPTLKENPDEDYEGHTVRLFTVAARLRRRAVGDKAQEAATARLPLLLDPIARSSIWTEDHRARLKQQYGRMCAVEVVRAWKRPQEHNPAPAVQAH